MSELESLTQKSSNLTNSQAESTTPSKESIVDCKNELILYFYNEMLPYIYDEFTLLDKVEEPDSDSELNFRGSECDVSIHTESEAKRSESTSDSRSVKQKPSKLSTGSKRISAKKSSFIKGKRSGVLPVIEEASQKVLKGVSTFSTVMKAASVTDEISLDTSASMSVVAVEEFAEIKFKDGGFYSGRLYKKLMDGVGTFKWSDGTIYEGEFKNGEITGKGKIAYCDGSLYSGEFCNGLPHGFGFFSPNSPLSYQGNWKYGKKEGKGWLQFKKGNFYDGEWHQDLKHGYGLRSYPDGTIYNGYWENGMRHGMGTIYYSNQDFYKGAWAEGYQHGYGEYTWNASLNEGIALSLENTYQGSWSNGKRNGLGLINFGMEGTKLATVFVDNKKHGSGIMVCGDGTIIQMNPLFQNDNPVQHIACKLNDNDKQACPKIIKRTTNKSALILDRKTRALSTAELHTQSKLLSLFPIQQVTYNPLQLPIHGNAIQINLIYHINRLINKHKSMVKNDVFSDIVSNPSMCNLFASGIRIKTINDDCHDLELSFTEEEGKLTKCILSNYAYIEEVYKKYASITATQPIKKPIMSRLLLWQFCRDIKLYSAGLSLKRIDAILLKIPDISLESEHFPFEKIHLWQFLHLLLAIAYKLFKSVKFFENNKEFGIYASMLNQFIKQYIVPNEGKFNGECLFKYKDLFPITAVYELYKTLGEPHSIRTFLRKCCTKKGHIPACYLKNESMPKKYTIRVGTNAVCTGLNLLYIPEPPPPIGEKVQQTPEFPFERDPFYATFKVFRVLGPKKIMQCVGQICPAILQDDDIVNINYNIIFLEFYEILILCTLELINQLKAEELKKQQELEVQSVNDKSEIGLSKNTKRSKSVRSAKSVKSQH